MIRTPSLRALDLFVTLMQTRSLSDAARRIGISQPAASLGLKELEAQIGVPLFVRTRQRLVPTPQADRLLPHAERLIGQANLVHREIVALRGGFASSLRVACTPSFGSTLLPGAIEGFRREQPAIDLRIEVEPLGRVLDLLRQEVVDLAFAYLPPTEDGATPRDDSHDRLLSTPLACLMPPDHVLAQRREVTLADLAEQTVILATRGYLPLPSAITDALHASGAGAGIMAVNNVYTAMSLARAGIGIALANPLLLLSGEAPGLIARPIHPCVTLVLGVMRALPHALTPEIEAFIGSARAAAQRCASQLAGFGIAATVHER